MNIAPNSLWSASLALVALVLFGGSAWLLAGEWRRVRHGRLIRRALDRTIAAQGQYAAASSDPVETDGPPSPSMPLPLHWLETRFGRSLVADEDRRLVEQCGYESRRAQWLFLVSRVTLAVLLPLLLVIYWQFGEPTNQKPLMLGGAFAIGFMAPKWLLRRRAARRREAVARELPFFVDLLRLLQGVGMSLDQSLNIMTAEFAQVLPVLAHELDACNRQYAQGRSREHSLQRLATLHENENMAGLVQLLVQVDRHGGAVQEPLRAFGERMRELRRSDMKTRIGKITVKMTGIMVATLLPALLIVTAGPGFLAVIRSLGALGK